MKRISLAFRSFFAILSGGGLPEGVARALGYTRPVAAKPAAPPATPADGALQILTVLQRDSRLVDFLMEDIAGYSDEQVGAAARTMHEQCRGALERYVRLMPVIDGVEGTFTKLGTLDAARVKLLGNVPASGKAAGGTLRHKGWRAESVALPPLAGPDSRAILAPAEIEIE